MLPSVVTHSSFTNSVVMSIAVSKVVVVLCRASSEKSTDSIGGISSFVRSLLRAGVQPTLDPALRPLCRSNAPTQGEEGNCVCGV